MPIAIAVDVEIPLPPDWSAERLVDFVLSASKRKAQYREVADALMALGMSSGAAALVIDRSHGGLFRAGLNRSAKPSKHNDSIEWVAYRRGRREPALLRAIFPEHFAPGGRFWSARRRWWQFWK